MKRRALLKIFAMTAVSHQLHALPTADMAGMSMSQAPAAGIPYTLQYFTEEESLLLDQLMEMILPADDHSPGAHEARTNLFADLIVATSSDAVKQQWRDGLRLMREEAALSTLADALHKASAGEEHPTSDLAHFFVPLKQMTVNGYYTSTIGIHQEMEYIGNTYLAAFPECTHPEHQEG